MTQLHRAHWRSHLVRCVAYWVHTLLDLTRFTASTPLTLLSDCVNALCKADTRKYVPGAVKTLYATMSQRVGLYWTFFLQVFLTR